MSEYDREYRGGGGGRGRRGGHGGGHGERHGRGVPLSELDPALTETSHRVIGCARDIHVALGPGYDKETYLTAMKAELADADIEFKSEHSVDVQYREQVVGSVVLDLLIADRFIVEVMGEPLQIGSFERSALRAKLKAADLELGLIINFSGRLLKDGLVRVLNPDKLGLNKKRDDEADHEDEYEDEEDEHDSVFE